MCALLRAAMFRHPALLLPFAAGATSIGSLLAYFAGLWAFPTAVALLLGPGLFLGAGFLVWARRARPQLADRVLAGMWAGALATLAYDIVRVPLVHAGLPVFKAISYFGTTLLATPEPTPLSELAGWTYHLSNGVGFAVMYACLVNRPHWLTAVAWGVFLEAAMLVTPYAEVFGYARGGVFTAITLGAHVIYGLGLWLGLRAWSRAFEPRERASPQEESAGGRRPSAAILVLGLVASLGGIGITAGDFHASYAETLEPSPPSYVGPHLYVTWDALEADRVAAMWVLRRHVEPRARFHFIAPFSRIPSGTPFDIPESDMRRTGPSSTTQVLLDREGLAEDPVLRRLGDITHYYEVTPWMPSDDPDVNGFGRTLHEAARACDPNRSRGCLEALFSRIDAWVAQERQTSSAPDAEWNETTKEDPS